MFDTSHATAELTIQLKNLHRLPVVMRTAQTDGFTATWPRRALAARPGMLLPRCSANNKVLAVVPASPSEIISASTAGVSGADISTPPSRAHNPPWTPPPSYTTTATAAAAAAQSAQPDRAAAAAAASCREEQLVPPASSQDAELHLSVLRRIAGATAVHIANGPMGRGLFTTTAVRAGQVLLSVPDVASLIVPDPENEPTVYDDGSEPTSAASGGGGGGSAAAGDAAFRTAAGTPVGDDVGGGGGGGGSPRGFYSAAEHADYLRRWQAFHDLTLPAGLVSLLTDSAALPAPARLAVWTMWLRRRCPKGDKAQEEEGTASTATAAAASCGRGVAFWRSYLASLPAPGDVTCLSAFSEEEAELLQVPRYLEQWRRTRDSLTWLLNLANHAAALDGEQQWGVQGGQEEADVEGGSEVGRWVDGEGLYGSATTAPSAWMVPAAASAMATATRVAAPAAVAETATATATVRRRRSGAAAAACYSLEELCYCYAIATSRCFHLPGRMLLVPYADMANHQPLWQASAFPFFQQKGDDGDGCDGGPEDGALHVGDDERRTNGGFQFRAVRDLAPGSEVCICYSEDGNFDQLSSYGFVRQANPYDRVDLTPHAPWPPTQDSEDSAWQHGERLPPDTRLCWPAVVAAAGFWGPRQASPPSPSPSPAPAPVPAEEQSLLRPRGSAALRLAVDPDPVVRMRLQRRRAALLSLPHTAADAAALRQEGLGWLASPEEELRRWARRGRGRGRQGWWGGQELEGAAAGTGAAGGVDWARVRKEEDEGEREGEGQPHGRRQGERDEAQQGWAASQLAAVRALRGVVARMERGMASTLSHDETLWAALTAPAGARMVGGGGGIVGALAGVLLGGGGGAADDAVRPSPAELALYDSPRGRTALLARLEYKLVLAQAAEILVSYDRVVEAVLSVRQSR